MRNECNEPMSEDSPLAYCPHCGQYVDCDGVLCDSCDYWLHYQCEGISDDFLEKRKGEYICISCCQPMDGEEESNSDKQQTEHTALKRHMYNLNMNNIAQKRHSLSYMTKWQMNQL